MNTTLLALRLNAGLSIPALGELAEVPEHVIRHAEKGGVPRPDNALRIARSLGQDVTDIWPVKRQAA